MNTAIILRKGKHCDRTKNHYVVQLEWCRLNQSGLSTQNQFMITITPWSIPINNEHILQISRQHSSKHSTSSQTTSKLTDHWCEEGCHHLHCVTISIAKFGHHFIKDTWYLVELISYTVCMISEFKSGDSCLY